MKKPKQLTREERIQIEPLHKRGLGPTEIGRLIGRDKSVISREVRRNRCADGVYRPGKAQERAKVRRARAPVKLKGETAREAESMLRDGRSPWEVSRLMIGERRVSAQAVYERIDRDADRGGFLHLHLPTRRKRRRPRKGRAVRRGPIPERRDITERPAGVATREEYGHWEGDTMHGSGERSGCLATLVERKSRMVVAVAMPRFDSVPMADAIAEALKGYRCKTITFDNGSEFAAHARISAKLKCECYFAHPGKPSQRGTNENANGLLRRHFPKRSTKFRRMRREQVGLAVARLNRKLRRSLGGKSANDHLPFLLAPDGGSLPPPNPIRVRLRSEGG